MKNKTLGALIIRAGIFARNEDYPDDNGDAVRLSKEIIEACGDDPEAQLSIIIKQQPEVMEAMSEMDKEINDGKIPICNICGRNIRACEHIPERAYDGVICTYEFEEGM